MKSILLTLTTLAIGLAAFVLPVQSMGQNSDQQAVPSNQSYEARYVNTGADKEGAFHYAKYPSGTYVFTDLDGKHKGFQTITFPEGYHLISNEIEEHQGFFVHHYRPKDYLSLSVYSYPDKQIIVTHE